MQDKTTILMRRMGVKTEKVRKGLFGHELRLSLDGKCGRTEVLCVVCKDGTNARVVNADKQGIFADCGKAPTDSELLFAVVRTPFYFDMAISAGKDADGFEWYFKVGGMLEITKPEIFAGKFRGEGDSLDVTTFESRLGTIPSTVLHDQITVDVLGVMSLEDKGADEKYADIRKNLEAWRSTNEAFVASAIDSAFKSFFGVDGVARLDVSEFHAQSPMREEAIAKEKAAGEKTVRDQIAKAESDRAAADAKQAEEERRAEELRDREHQLKLAELDKKIAALSGPRPEIRMKTRVYVQGSNVNTRDLFADTSTTFITKRLDPGYSAHAIHSPRPVNRLSIGDVVGLELSSNIDGWLHLFNYGTSGNVYQLVPGEYSRLSDGRIFANQTYVADRGGDLISVPLREGGPTTAQYGYMERFIAIITKYPVDISTASVKAMFDRRNPGKVCATRGGFGSVEEVRQPDANEPVEVAVATLLDLPPEDWVQGTLELEVV